MDEEGGRGEEEVSEQPHRPPVPALTLPSSLQLPSSSTPTSPTSPSSSSPHPATTPRSPTYEDKAREPVIDPNSPHYRDHLLLTEFKYLPEKISGGGIYAMPSFDSLYLWHCTIFIRQGVYRSGVFRFIMTIPANYPSAPPEIRFVTPIFHPLIGLDGTFDISHEFPDWKSQRHFLFKVLAYAKKVFYQLDLCTTQPSLNKEAHALYTTDRRAFLARAEESMRNSIEKVFENPEGSSIKFSPYTKDMDSVRDSILKEKQKDTLLSWVSKGVSSLISFKY